MRALTPRRLAHAGKASLLTLLCRPNIPPPTTPWARPSPLIHVGVIGRVLPPRLRLGIADSPHHGAETGSLSCGLLVRLRLLPTPPPANKHPQSDDAVAFSYMWRDLTWVGLSPPDRTTSQTHDSGFEALGQRPTASPRNDSAYDSNFEIAQLGIRLTQRVRDRRLGADRCFVERGLAFGAIEADARLDMFGEIARISRDAGKPS
jgi:hypothetical protein